MIVWGPVVEKRCHCNRRCDHWLAMVRVHPLRGLLEIALTNYVVALKDAPGLVA